MRSPLFVLFFCWASFSAFTGTAQEVIRFNNVNKILPIGKEVYFFEDKTNKLTIDDVTRENFQSSFVRSQSLAPNFANTTSTIWFRFTASNETGDECILQITKTLIHHIELFYPVDSNGYKSKLVGALHPMKDRDIEDNFFLFKLLPPQAITPKTFYIKFNSEESLEVPLSLGTLEKIFDEHRKEELFFGAFIGLMVGLIIYNLFIYFSVREKFYLYYVIYIIAVLFLNDMIVSGIGFEYFWPDYPQLNFYANVFTSLVYIIIILFSTSFLNTAINIPTLHKGFYFFYAINIIIIILNLSGDFFISSIGTQVGGFLLGSYLIVVAVKSFILKIQAARFYLLGWGIFLICGLIYVLFLNGLLPSNRFTENATLIGSGLEGILLSLALADRINILRKEKIQAQQEKLALIQDQNIKLEQLVAERTQELQSQHEEIISQNEEMLTQQEHITQQNQALQERNQDLEEAQQTIAQQHEELKKHSENLEYEITLRAKDLMKSNQELIEQNHQLEQFSFITAHNLRAPVARIQGLANVLEISEDDAEKKEIIGRMIGSSKDLDQVIHDLAKILDLRKGTHENFDIVDLDEKVERVKSMLKDEISQSHAVITCNLNAAPIISSLPQYIESILFNLISNAIKYKAFERAPHIMITTLRTDDTVVLEVKDNGIGIDLQKFKDKVFTLYQRFHVHVEGKGLGLHLVKTQVEALGGKIEIDSTLQVGTTFTITLPSNLSEENSSAS